MSNIHIDLADRSYDVWCGYGMLNSLGEKISSLKLSDDCALITDSNVGAHYAESVMTALIAAGISVSQHVVEAGEASKSMVNVEKICREMTQAGHGRKSFVLALGGGVVGDLAGFVAAIFYRGIPFVQIPTTIVSQVDSSVGGKTGVNIAEGKNLVGAFHQPKMVIVDPITLSTLPGREYREGYAEVIKHAAIRDAAMFDDLEKLDPTDQQPPADLLARNLAIKARVVEEDEQELNDTRALLNFGHTIGHGIEASLPYGELLHGEAISLGIRAAVYLSQKRSTLSVAEGTRILALLAAFQLPLILEDKIATDIIIEKLLTDKKFSSGSIRFVLLKALGISFVSDEITEADLREAIEHLRSAIK
ncbi:MAG: 3-dehydroquinate synthase [Rubritalea sp.]|jgi:3-dehydroquinate synthase